MRFCKCASLEIGKTFRSNHLFICRWGIMLSFVQWVSFHMQRPRTSFLQRYSSSRLPHMPACRSQACCLHLYPSTPLHRHNPNRHTRHTLRSYHPPCMRMTMPRHARSSPVPTMSSVTLSDSDAEKSSENDTMPEKPRPAKRLKYALPFSQRQAVDSQLTMPAGTTSPRRSPCSLAPNLTVSASPSTTISLRSDLSSSELRGRFAGLNLARLRGWSTMIRMFSRRI